MSYKVLSFDVGIKNLPYCIIEYIGNKNCKILDWGIINILNIDNNELICCGKTQKGDLCSKKCKNYILSNDEKIGYCGIHLKKIIKNENIKIHTEKKININKMDMQLLFSYLINGLDKSKLTSEVLLDIDEILIENQPALKNPRMKTIQVGLYTYYYIRYFVDKKSNRLKSIKLISAINKLKVYDGPKIESTAKNKYARNKDLSIKYCEYLIKNDEKNIQFFLNHKKKDDLADSYLQGLYYIYQKFKLITKNTKNKIKTT